MTWLAALLAFNAIVFAALHFKPLSARSGIISIHQRRARS